MFRDYSIHFDYQLRYMITLQCNAMQCNGIALSVGDALGRPATVKCRIGVDDADSYEGTCTYVDTPVRTVVASCDSPLPLLSHLVCMPTMSFHLILYCIMLFLIISSRVIPCHVTSLNPTSPIIC